MSKDDQPNDQPLTRTEDEGETLDMPEGMRPFIKGQVLGERYQILEMLGRGGMGEVWHAFDLKLRVEVALKALREDLFKDERRLEMLRQEVRAAREVLSPNVCRIFDLIEVEDRELVSMEYVDGATLLGVLQKRGPLELKEAQDIASQFLAGLEAIHKVGLIHRDIKPENIMLTRAGRVVVMDFGLARQETEGGGSVSGTPAYMAPEQAAGRTVDARADVYSAGIVLAEMVSPEGIKSFESRQSVWDGVRSEPAKLPDSPWAPAIKKAVAKDREGRYHTAHTLTRALEDVTLRVEGAEDLHPYPGLASFTETDAEYFFGREAEVERMWRKLEGPPRMLAIMGPSGAGKSSFIAAGLIANAPPDWRIIRSTPGNAAISSLAGVVARETAGDPDAVELLPRFDDADVAVQLLSRWGRKNANSLLVVDQFEELFTQNSSDEQQRFADLLSRFVLEGDVHVLLSMRDDFAASCNPYESLRPIFHELTVLDPPTGANLRRAMVQPAQKCGYRFEDDDLVVEMLAEVEGERGALPLLAFAAARLWEKRDRETGLLTRQAYQDIGGVGGALARHAEATIDRIGSEHTAIVRELFRNLVTAEGTRAVREWDEVLSVFEEPQRQPAEEVLRELIDARLLTSYEVREEDREPTRRVEIIHESLLASWPRLVRWQTQDADATQLRDQLRQAARTWNEHERSDDLLWAGTAFREYQLWRERYPGGLTEREEDFARAMTAHARRRRRRRRFAVAAAFVVLLAILGVVGASRQQAIAEANRAEAHKLVALGRLELESYPAEALAFATSSLEVFDTQEARRLALEALWKGPTLFVLETGPDIVNIGRVRFNPDGRLLAAHSIVTDEVFVWSESGQGPEVLGAGDTPDDLATGLAFNATGEVLVSGGLEAKRFWSVPGFELIRQLDLSEGSTKDERRRSSSSVSRDRILTKTFKDGRFLYRSWPLEGGAPAVLGWWDPEGIAEWGADPTGRYMMFTRGRKVFLRPLDFLESSHHDRLVARHPGDVVWCNFTRAGDLLACIDQTGDTRFWSTDPDPQRPLRVLRGPEGHFWFDASGTKLALTNELGMWIWNVDGPPDADPFVINWPRGVYVVQRDFHPSGHWLAGSAHDRILFLLLGGPSPRVLSGHTGVIETLTFVGEGTQLASASNDMDDETVRLWPLSAESGETGRILWERAGVSELAADPSGRHLMVSTFYDQRNGGVFLLPIAEGQPSATNFWPYDSFAWPVTVSLDGRHAAAGAAASESDEGMVIRVWDLESGEERVLALRDSSVGDGQGVFDRGVGRLQFTPEGDLLSNGVGGVRRWNLETGEGQWFMRVPEPSFVWMDASRDARFFLTAELPVIGSNDGGSNLTLHDLDHGTSHRITSHGQRVDSLAIDPTGTIVVTTAGGVIQVGSADGSEPHLLFGHEGTIDPIAISPDSRWIASGGEDAKIRLWPMPDLSKPPLHTLPHDELISKLKTLTNLRVVRDDESATGWTIVIGPFPGWADVPEW